MAFSSERSLKRTIASALEPSRGSVREIRNEGSGQQGSELLLRPGPPSFILGASALEEVHDYKSGGGLRFSALLSEDAPEVNVTLVQWRRPHPQTSVCYAA